MNTKKQKDIITFFLKHPEYFTSAISSVYPLSNEQLLRYKNILDWNKVSENTNIVWSRELMNSFSDSLDWKILSGNSAAFKDISLFDEFQDRIDWKGEEDNDWDSIAANEGLPWDMAFIEKHESKIDFGKLSSNTKVKWSEELLIKYSGRWNMINLAGNKSFPWDIRLFDKYLDESYLLYFNTYTNETLIRNIDFVEKYKAILNWDFICSNPNLPWFERDLLHYWKPYLSWWGLAQNHSLFQQDKDFFSTHIDKWKENNYNNFRSLSHNEALTWSIPFIEKYLDYWSWDSLSLNKGLPWSIELIEHFSQLWVWGVNFTYPEPIQDGEFTLLGGIDMGLVNNESLPWSLEFLQHFENKIELRALASNPAIWDKAFKPFVDDKMIDTVMKLIL